MTQHADHSATATTGPAAAPAPTPAAEAPMTVRFKEGCWDLHQSAEAADLPKRLLKGQLSRDEYAQYLGQMLLLARTLDERVIQARSDVPALAALVDDAQLQAPYLEADLKALGVEPGSVDPLPETANAIRLVADAAANDPLALLGLHYVREGANNGNRFIAMKLRQVMNLEGSQATRYLDPYGDEQPARWAAFKQTLDQQPFTPEEKDRLVAAAREMFLAIMAVNEGVARNAG